MHKVIFRDCLKRNMVGCQIKCKYIHGKTWRRLRLIFNAKRLPWPQNYKIFSNVYASGKVIFPKHTGW
jgi:hypothetical protein